MRQIRLHGREAERFARELGRTIRQKRKSKGLSQLDLASELGFDQSQLSKVESGANMPLVTTAAMLCRRLGIDWLEVWDRAQERAGAA